jgi:aspartate racemase
VFDQIQQGTGLPLISIVDATRQHAVQLGVGKLGLLGTKFTMESDFYPRAFNEARIELAVPGPEEIDYIQEKLFTEIEFGIIKESTKKGLLSIIDKMEGDERIEGVILGCTELPLILKPDDLRLHHIDTTAIHIARIVERCRDE